MDRREEREREREEIAKGEGHMHGRSDEDDSAAAGVRFLPCKATKEKEQGNERTIERLSATTIQSGEAGMVRNLSQPFACRDAFWRYRFASDNEPASAADRRMHRSMLSNTNTQT
jgi:hypothetical protein